MKKIQFTFLLIIVFSLASLAQTNAVAPSGSGTEADPYQITSLANLSWVAQNSSAWSAVYKQTTDIDASETQYWDDTDDDGDGDLYNDPNDITTTGDNEGWLPIGNGTTQFKGIYDGDGHTISNLTLHRGSVESGFFGRIKSGATIKGLGLSSVSMYAESYIGALVGRAESSTTTIENCYSTGTVSVGGSGYRIGGMVGWLSGATMKNSYSSCTVTGTTTGSYVVGGLVGYLYYGAKLENCYATGNVSSLTSEVGGLVGSVRNSSPEVSKCYATGNVKGTKKTGGLIGMTYTSTTATISNCYSLGDVTRISGSADLSLGAFVGLNEAGNTIEKCYSTGSVNVEDGTAITDGGFIQDNKGTASDCFWDSDASNQTTGNGATAKTTTEMNTSSTFSDAGWDGSIWYRDDTYNNKYPYLSWQNPSGTPVPVELVTFTAAAKDGAVLLTWSTATEVNNYGFEIQKSVVSSQMSDWETIGFVEGAGNSNSPKQYSFVDANVSGKVSYRLKQIDMDGGFEYSEVVTVANGLAKTELYQNSPNPFNPTTRISFSLASPSNVNISVYNVLGEKVAELVNGKMEAGAHKVNFNATDLTSGVYIYKICTPNYTKSMKMMLLK